MLALNKREATSCTHGNCTRQGRRPQARSVGVGADGNGILVKKNLSGGPRNQATSSNTRLPIAKIRRAPKGVLQRARDLATSKRARHPARLSSVDRASRGTAANRNPADNRASIVRKQSRRFFIAPGDSKRTACRRRSLKPCSHAPLRFAVFFQAQPFQAILPAIVPAPACS